MSYFPLFIDLKDKRCTVIGGGKIAGRRIKALHDCGADITVISPEVSEEVASVCSKIITRRYQRGDVDGAFLVIAATSSPDINREIYLEAVEKNILVNSVNAVAAEDKSDCAKNIGFLFPAVAKAGDIVVGIVTAGTNPKLSKLLRQKIEALISRL